MVPGEARQVFDAAEHVEARDRESWRAWLEANHRSSAGAWLVYQKKESGRPSVSYAEAVEEALCFGWIDSKPNAIDATSYKQWFSPRKPRSPWSRINKDRVERLLAAGRMTDAGMASIAEAQQNGSWTSYEVVETLRLPDDLAAALALDVVAADHFEAFPPSSKKNILWWIQSAKRPETRAARVAETVRLAAVNKRANHYRQ